jgi:phosphotransferase system enzyme I (PtsI)
MPEPGQIDIKQEKIVKGIGIVAGEVVGIAYIKPLSTETYVERDISDAEIPAEIARFESAIIETRRQLRQIQKDSDPAVASIFDLHLLILDDKPFIESVFLGIESRKKSVEAVLKDVSQGFIQSLTKLKDDYVKERAADVQDVTKRLLNNLAGGKTIFSDIINDNTIIVAVDLSPSDIVGLDKNKVKGILLDLGSPTSHAAILAVKLGIPTVVGLHNITEIAHTGDTVFIDGERGIAIVQPQPDRIEQVKTYRILRQEREKELANLRNMPAETLDGYEVELAANIEVPTDVDDVIRCGAEGVGLFRTEYFYMSKQSGTFPSEDEQYEAYATVAKRLAPMPVIIRTLDLGGDKFLNNADISWDEANPFMGWRAIRFCLAQPDVFRTQLRAVLRASVLGNVKLMYPMVSNIDEILRANLILEQAKKELLEKGYPFNPHMEIGAMIEVPSAALIADKVVRYVDFFSLGTNDLIQYTLAIDRGNDRVAYLYEPAHLAILRLIKHTIDVAHQNGKWTGLCGGMASDPLFIPLLIGLGIDELSVNPNKVLEIKDTVRKLNYSQCRQLADMAMTTEATVDIQELFGSISQKKSPEIVIR